MSAHAVEDSPQLAWNVGIIRTRTVKPASMLFTSGQALGKAIKPATPIPVLRDLTLTLMGKVTGWCVLKDGTSPTHLRLLVWDCRAPTMTEWLSKHVVRRIFALAIKAAHRCSTDRVTLFVSKTATRIVSAAMQVTTSRTKGSFSVVKSTRVHMLRGRQTVRFVLLLSVALTNPTTLNVVRTATRGAVR
jgi:hypothetical protein